MPLWLTSVLAAGGFGFFFLLLSIFSKREDFMLDDYTEDDKPDNVRIIERDKLKIVEKEIEVEVEKPVRDIEEENRLKDEIKSIMGSKREVEEKLNDREDYIKSILKDLSDLDSEYKDFKEKSGNKIKEVREKADNKIREIKELNKSLESENKTLIEKNKTLVEENKEIEELSEKKDLDVNIIIEGLEKKNKTLISKVNKLTKEIEEEDKVIKTKDEEISKEKKNIDDLIRDRDYFIDLAEKQKKEIEKLRSNGGKEFIKRPNVYSGVDDYGTFYDISIIGDKFPKPHVEIIEDVIGKMDSDQFAHYTINSVTGHKSLEIHHVNTLPSFIERVQRKKTDGKYKTYIILDSRVYYYETY